MKKYVSASTKLNEGTKVTLTLGQLRRLVKEAITTAQDTGDQLFADIADDRISQSAYRGNFKRDETRVVEVLDAATADVQEWLDEIGWWDEVPSLEKTINKAISDERRRTSSTSTSYSNFSFVCGIQTSIIPFETELEHAIEEKFKLALKVNGIEKVLMHPKDWEDKLDIDVNVMNAYPYEISIFDGGKRIRATTKLESPEEGGEDTWFLYRLIVPAVKSKLTEAGYLVTNVKAFHKDGLWRLQVAFKLKPMATHDDDSISTNAAEAIIPASKVRRLMERRSKRRFSDKDFVK